MKSPVSPPFIAALLLFCFALNLSAQQSPVAATLLSEVTTFKAGEPFRVALKIVHEPTYHTYGKDIPKDKGLPNEIVWALPEGWKAEDLPWPATHLTPSTDGATVPGYSDTVYLPVKLTPPASLKEGESVTLSGTMKGLVCDPKSCRPIKLPFTLELKSAATALPDAAVTEMLNALPTTADTGSATSAAVVTKKESLGLMLVFGFIGGLILNIMPCVFPVLGIKITSVVSQAGEDKKQVLLHALAYTFGVLASFWALVVLLQLFHVSWGGQFQSPLFVYGMVILFTVFGLNMFGLFEVGSSAVGVGSGLMRKSELSGSFFSGLLATVVSTPCSAPFLAPALAYGLALTLVPSLLFFTVIGLGLASPYLVLSLFPSLLKLLPRPGAWMESFKQSMSFLMLGAAAFFAWVLQGLISETSQRDLLIGIVIVAAACWVYGRWCVISKPTKTRLISGVTALGLFAGGLAWGWPQPKDSTWQPWSPELVKSLREQGKPVYIDFTARWCASCQVNKRVYKDRALQEDLKAKGITLLKADWTDHDERITEAISALNKAAVPVNVLYLPGKEEPHVLPELLTVDNVRAALAKVESAK